MFIYLLHHKRKGLYKIGKSKNVEVRLSNIRKQYNRNPSDIQLVDKWHYSQTRHTEETLHHLFADRRVHQSGLPTTEWFALSHQDASLLRVAFALEHQSDEMA